MPFIQRAVGGGIAVYAVMHLVWTGLLTYGLGAGMFSLILRLITLALVTTLMTRSLRLVSRMDVLPYSAAWAVMAVILDGIFFVPLAGWALYATWTVWLGYALVVVIPYLAFPYVRRGARTR